MDLLVKKASALSSDDLAAEGLTGIPADWPIESFPYVGQSIPDGFEQMTDTDMQALKDNNQAAYDAWLNSLRPLPAATQPTPVSVKSINNFGLSGADSITLNTHDFSDRTTWYQRSVAVADEALSDSGDGLTFNSANPWWVNMDSDRLTYDYKVVPERDGTYSDRSLRRPVVKVNGTEKVLATDYTVDFVNGKITFLASQSGNTVTCSYYHTNNVDRRSEWLLHPPAEKAFLLDYIEVQFSQNISFDADMLIEIWAGGTVDDYSDFNQDLYDAGYGQNKSRYRGAKDFLNICTNRSSQIIPAFGGLAHDVLIFPFDYLVQAQIKASQGTVVVFALVNDVAYSTGELATATFYMQIIPETSLQEAQ